MISLEFFRVFSSHPFVDTDLGFSGSLWRFHGDIMVIRRDFTGFNHENWDSRRLQCENHEGRNSYDYGHILTYSAELHPPQKKLYNWSYLDSCFRAVKGTISSYILIMLVSASAMEKSMEVLPSMKLAKHLQAVFFSFSLPISPMLR